MLIALDVGRHIISPIHINSLKKNLNASRPSALLNAFLFLTGLPLVGVFVKLRIFCLRVDTPSPEGRSKSLGDDDVEHIVSTA